MNPALQGCQYCEARAKKESREAIARRRMGIAEPPTAQREPGTIVWDHRTIGFQQRTNETLEEYAAMLEGSPNITDYQGVIGK